MNWYFYFLESHLADTHLLPPLRPFLHLSFHLIYLIDKLRLVLPCVRSSSSTPCPPIATWIPAACLHISLLFKENLYLNIPAISPLYNTSISPPAARFACLFLLVTYTFWLTETTNLPLHFLLSTTSASSTAARFPSFPIFSYITWQTKIGRK